MPKHFKYPENDDDWNEAATQEFQICADLNDRSNHHSLDFLDRKLEGEVPVFVYGTLKQGGYSHEVLEGTAYLGHGISTVDKFYMEETSSFPVLFEIKERTTKTLKKNGRVFGEVYAVDPITLLRLDQIENNGRMYKRSLQWIRLIDQDKCKLEPTIHAWVYTGVPEYWGSTTLPLVDFKTDSKGKVYDWKEEKKQGRLM